MTLYPVSLARELMKDSEYADSTEIKNLLQEAEELVGEL